jgi:Kef-type K+ transport system membrane component KefB
MFSIYFRGVAMCVTAFPVLARIVKEKQLFGTRVGVTALSTAAWADVAAWTLLALSISLISGGSKLNILWTFLSLIAFAIIMFGPVRWGLRKWIVRKDGKPRPITPTMFSILLVATLVSAWITAYVGLHSIFGAFIFGIILPRDGNFCVHLAEKYEDFVTAFFLPLYFTASGLRTQLGLLKDGNTWGLLLLLVSVAIITKVASGTFSARITGLSWRESFTLGVLMNTKGLVELIVLNIGLDNKLISPTTFSMMIVLALVTTFLTSPIVHYIYPYYRIVEFENQTPGKTVLVTALRERIDVAPILGVFSLITSGRPKKYRMRAVHTLALTDRPSAYMSGSHTDDILDHVYDLSQILTLRVKTIPMTYDDTETQKVEQLAQASASLSSNFYFTVWRIPTSGEDEGDRLSPSVTLGGSIVRKIFTSNTFRGNLAVLIDRDWHSNSKTITFVYTGSAHDIQAAKLVKAMLHTPGAHISVIYAMNPLIHANKINSAAEIQDPILASLFRKERQAAIELIVVHEHDMTNIIVNALNAMEETGLVVCGSDMAFGVPSPEGINYREIVCGTLCSFLVVSKGVKASKSDSSDNENELNSVDMETTTSTEAPTENHQQTNNKKKKKNKNQKSSRNGSSSKADQIEPESSSTSFSSSTNDSSERV